MAKSTIYDIKLRYLVEDKAARGVKNLDREMRKAAKTSGMLSGSLRKIAGAATAFFGFRAAKSALIDFNSGLEQSRITMAGMLKLNVGGEWSTNMKRANFLVERFQQISKKSVGTTKDFVDMAQMIIRPLSSAGASMKGIEDITAGATVAARAFGMEASFAAADIEQMVMGTIGKKDRFARALISPLKLTTQEFNKLSEAERLRTINMALTSDAIKDMAKAQEGSFSGVMSTFQDTLQQTLAKVGLPLFQALTAEVQSWNAWIDRNQKSIQSMAKSLSSGLVTAFKVIKSVASFFASHASTLIFVAKTIAALKIGQAVGGFVGGGINIMGRMASFGKALSTGGSSMGDIMKAGKTVPPMFEKLAASIGTRLIPGIALAYVAFKGLKGIFDDSLSTKQKEQQADLKIGDQAMRGIFEARKKAVAGIAAITGSVGARDIARLGGKGQVGFMGEMVGVTAAEKQKIVEQAGFQRETGSAMAIAKNLPLMQREEAGLPERQKQMLEIYRKQLAQTEGDFASTRKILFEKGLKSGAIREHKGQFAVQGRTEKWLDDLGLAAKEKTLLERELKFLIADINAGKISLESLHGVAVKERDEGQDFLNLPGQGKGAKVDVTINSIEIQSEDPDRFVFGLTEALADAASNPSAAAIKSGISR